MPASADKFSAIRNQGVAVLRAASRCSENVDASTCRPVDFLFPLVLLISIRSDPKSVR
jgi:hypothetical protein